MPHPTVIPHSRRDRELAFNAARGLLAQAQQTHRHQLPHRALSRIRLNPWLLLQMVGLPVVWLSLIYALREPLYGFWRNYLLTWAQWLHMPLQPAAVSSRQDLLGMSWLPGASDLGLSITTGAALAAVLTVVAWGLALRLRGRWLPAQYLVRVLCVVQALALLYFWFAPMPFPHLVLNHVMDLLDAGYLLILAIPVLMALGYYPLQISWQAKVVHTLLILLFFGVMVPQQAMVHLLVLQHLSVVFMPLLYLCFGALFDMMVFVALYAWAASTAPLSATH
ncbi:hypothetical protein LJR189_002478 [Acidovorax delafieldii]|uniref:hypothetical protein n=1 Tax=Acidovorax delafieldii TaxID=47920 RepID=UPI003ED09381